MRFVLFGALFMALLGCVGSEGRRPGDGERVGRTVQAVVGNPACTEEECRCTAARYALGRCDAIIVDPFNACSGGQCVAGRAWSESADVGPSPRVWETGTISGGTTHRVWMQDVQELWRTACPYVSGGPMGACQVQMLYGNLFIQVTSDRVDADPPAFEADVIHLTSSGWVVTRLDVYFVAYDTTTASYCITLNARRAQGQSAWTTVGTYTSDWPNEAGALFSTNYPSWAESF